MSNKIRFKLLFLKGNCKSANSTHIREQILKYVGFKGVHVLIFWLFTSYFLYDILLPVPRRRLSLISYILLLYNPLLYTYISPLKYLPYTPLKIPCYSALCRIGRIAELLILKEKNSLHVLTILQIFLLLFIF